MPCFNHTTPFAVRSRKPQCQMALASTLVNLANRPPRAAFAPLLLSDRLGKLYQ